MLVLCHTMLANLAVVHCYTMLANPDIALCYVVALAKEFLC